jgi:hypothetical protein
MGYLAGDTILDDEYNVFVNQASTPFGINAIMGTGTGNLGLGQPTVPTIEAGEVITAAKWNALFTAMDNIGNHTNPATANAGTSARTAGDPIAAVAAITADLGRLEDEVQGGSVRATAIAAGSEDLSIVASAVYDTSHICEGKFTFAGGDEARFFFNAGGKLRINFTNAKTNDTGKDASVDALIAALGNLDIGATVSTRSGSGETLTANGLALGYYDLTTSYQTVIHLTEDSGDYSGDIAVKIEMKSAGAHGDGRGNTGIVITVKCSLLQNETTRDDYTSGNLSSIIVEEEAVGPTDFSFRTMDPTTAQGLDPVYISIAVASVSNAIVNAD